MLKIRNKYVSDIFTFTWPTEKEVLYARLEIVICLTRVTCNVSLVLFVLNNPNEERERGKEGCRFVRLLIFHVFYFSTIGNKFLQRRYPIIRNYYFSMNRRSRSTESNILYKTIIFTLTLFLAKREIEKKDPFRSETIRLIRLYVYSTL